MRLPMLVHRFSTMCVRQFWNLTRFRAATYKILSKPIAYPTFKFGPSFQDPEWQELLAGHLRAHQMLLFYGPSGLGKSAGIRHALAAAYKQPVLPLSFRSASTDDAFREALYGSVHLSPDSATNVGISAPVLGNAVVEACNKIRAKTGNLPVVLLDEFDGCILRDANGLLQISNEGSQFFLKLVDAYAKGQISLIVVVGDDESARLLTSLSGASSRLQVVLYPSIDPRSILPMLENTDWYKEIEDTSYAKSQCKPQGNVPRKTKAAMIQAIVNVVGAHMEDLLRAFAEVFGSRRRAYQAVLQTMLDEACDQILSLFESSDFQSRDFEKQVSIAAFHILQQLWEASQVARATVQDQTSPVKPVLALGSASSGINWQPTPGLDRTVTQTALNRLIAANIVVRPHNQLIQWHRPRLALAFPKAIEMSTDLRRVQEDFRLHMNQKLQEM
eukprot:TRINITY_DN6712_c0_g1_i3.p1 TRINITY_DN6712_c0_g1~~TRINITY_DN6712_c0_g1_i3.p1  ORF type:complete len:445 (+),score=57.47 TRINITY_DN6712_c0_g1_i3:546-1880(+)